MSSPIVSLLQCLPSAYYAASKKNCAFLFLSENQNFVKFPLNLIRFGSWMAK